MFQGQQGQPVSFEDLFARLGDVSGRLATAGAQNTIGLDANEIGVGPAANRALSAERFDLSQLFQSLRPFEQRDEAEAVAGLRGAFGTAGGRFSRNLLEGEGRLRGELANQQARRREEIGMQSFQDAEQRRIAALGQILPALLNQQQIGGGQANDLLRTILGFGQAGAPVQDPGILPGLLGAATNIGGVGLLPGGFLRGEG